MLSLSPGEVPAGDFGISFGTGGDWTIDFTHEVEGGTVPGPRAWMEVEGSLAGPPWPPGGMEWFHGGGWGPDPWGLDDPEARFAVVWGCLSAGSIEAEGEMDFVLRGVDALGALTDEAPGGIHARQLWHAPKGAGPGKFGLVWEGAYDGGPEASLVRHHDYDGLAVLSSLGWRGGAAEWGWHLGYQGGRRTTTDTVPDEWWLPVDDRVSSRIDALGASLVVAPGPGAWLRCGSQVQVTDTAADPGSGLPALEAGAWALGVVEAWGSHHWALGGTTPAWRTLTGTLPNSLAGLRWEGRWDVAPDLDLDLGLELAVARSGEWPWAGLAGWSWSGDGAQAKAALGVEDGGKWELGMGTGMVAEGKDVRGSWGLDVGIGGLGPWQVPGGSAREPAWQFESVGWAMTAGVGWTAGDATVCLEGAARGKATPVKGDWPRGLELSGGLGTSCAWRTGVSLRVDLGVDAWSPLESDVLDWEGSVSCRFGW